MDVNHIKKIGAWHRLFIALALVYIIPILYFVCTFYPSSSVIYQNWYRELYTSLNIVPDYKSVNYQTYKEQNYNLTYYQLIQKIENNMRTKQKNYSIECIKSPNPFCTHPKTFINNIERKIYEKCIKTPDPFCTYSGPYINDLVRIKYENQLKSLKKKQLETIFEGLLLWATPLILLYFIVFLIRWVYIGFKNENR